MILTADDVSVDRQKRETDLPDKVLKHHHQTILRTGLYGKVRVQEGAKH